MNPVRRLLGPLREFGVPVGLAYIADRVLRAATRRSHIRFYELMVQPVAEAPLLSPRARAAYQIREIEPGAPELARFPIPAAIIDFRYAQGSTCLGAFRKGEMLGYMWLCPEKFDEDEVSCTYLCEPASSSCFDFDFYLFPDHRFGRGFAALWEGANEWMRERGVERTYSRVSRFNLVSRASHARLAAHRIGIAFFLMLGRLQLAVLSDSPYIDVRRRHGRRLELALHER